MFYVSCTHILSGSHPNFQHNSLLPFSDTYIILCFLIWTPVFETGHKLHGFNLEEIVHLPLTTIPVAQQITNRSSLCSFSSRPHRVDRSCALTLWNNIWQIIKNTLEETIWAVCTGLQLKCSLWLNIREYYGHAAILIRNNCCLFPNMQKRLQKSEGARWRWKQEIQLAYLPNTLTPVCSPSRTQCLPLDNQPDSRK